MSLFLGNVCSKLVRTDLYIWLLHFYICTSFNFVGYSGSMAAMDCSDYCCVVKWICVTLYINAIVEKI